MKAKLNARQMASGCALGTVVSEALGALILCAHFFCKINTAGLSRHFSLRDFYCIVRASFGNVSVLIAIPKRMVNFPVR